MGVHEESMATDLTRIRTVLDAVSAGSGITVEAAVDVGAQIGVLNASSVQINPSTEETVNQIRLNTARVSQPSGQQTMANSSSVVVASDQRLTFAVTPSGQQAMNLSIPVVLASDQRLTFAVTPSGQQTMINSVPVTIATNQNILPVSVAVSGQQVMANSFGVTLARDQNITIAVTPSGQQPMATSIPFTLATDHRIIPVSVASSGIMTVGDHARTQAMTSGFMHAIYKTITNSNTRATAVTADSGRRLQIFEINAVNYSTAPVWFEVYYGFGNDITTNPSGYLLNTYLSNTTLFPGKIWELGGPLSSASDVISVRTSGIWPNQPDIASSGVVKITYRQI